MEGIYEIDRTKSLLQDLSEKDIEREAVTLDGKSYDPKDSIIDFLK